MKENIAEILKEALKLPPEARAALAGTLLESLDETVDRDVWKFGKFGVKATLYTLQLINKVDGHKFDY